MKKILFAVLASLGLLIAVPAFAAAVAPVPSSTGMTVTGTAITQGSPAMAEGAQQMLSGGVRVMPCPIMNQTMGSNMMYRQPCATQVYSNYMGYNGFSRDMMSWLGLMFVVTVVLIWAVLLLVIALLWKMLQRHRHDHRHHHEHHDHN